jgi:hypothetical protein
MKIMSQAMHLLKFDLLRTKWWLATFAVVLGVSVYTALNASASGFGVDNMIPYLLVLLGMVATIIVIQGDSLFRPDAFWRGQAVHPGSLLMAKSLTIGMLFVLLPIVVTLLVVASFDLPLADVTRLVQPAFPLLGWCIAVTALVAVCTTDAKSAILLFIGTQLGWFLISIAAEKMFPAMRMPDLRIPLLPVFVAMGSVVAAVYLRGLTRRTAMVASALLMTAGLYSMTTRRDDHRAVGVPTATADSEMLELTDVVLRGDGNFNGAPYVRVRLQRERPGVRYELSNALMTAYFVSGDSVNVPLNGRLENGSVRELLTLPSGMQWRPASSVARAHDGALMVPLSSPSQVVTRIRVHATVERYVATELASAPFAKGVVFRTGGRQLALRDSISATRRTLVADWAVLGENPLVAGMSFGSVHYSRPYLFVLQNTARGEALTLNQASQGGQQGAFILPGVVRRWERFVFTGADAIDPSLEPEWLKSATLRVLRWTRNGIVQVSAERTLRP